MKKLIVLSLLLTALLCNVINAQSTSKENVIPSTEQSLSIANQSVQITEAERIVDKYIDKTSEILTGFAEKLKVPVEHVYSVLVKQQRVYGIEIIIAFIVTTILLYFSVKINYNFIQKHEGEFMPNGEFLVWLLVIVSAILVIISFVMLLVNGLPGLINPEYGAMKDILSLIN